MKTDRSTILTQIIEERMRQIEMGNDDEYISPFELNTVLSRQLGGVSRAILYGDKGEMEARLIRLAAVSVAFLEILPELEPEQNWEREDGEQGYQGLFPIEFNPID